MTDLQNAVAQLVAEQGFSGVVRIDRPGAAGVTLVAGLADRAHGVPNEIGTRFGIASVTKGLTALTVMSLVEAGRLDLDTTARAILGDDLPDVDDRVTVELLLAHRSGIGDYVDEEAGLDVTDHVLTVPVHVLATTEGYLPALRGHRAKFAPGDGFSYCNSGYVLLALMAERVTGTDFPGLVATRVCGPAGMVDTGFLRSDELPGTAALGYLTDDGLRTNALHLPVRGSGDGGAYSTVADLHRLWHAFFDGRIVPRARVADMVRPRSRLAGGPRYGLGFWLHASGGAVRLEGYDAGVSVRSVHDPSTGTTFTVVSNTSNGAWPVARFVEEQLLG